jgi:subtilase family serine protease
MPVVAASSGSSVARDLVTGQVDVTRASTLAESKTAWFAQASDVGAAPDDLRLRGLSVVLQRPAEREQLLQQRLAQMQNPQSPEYHHWLSPTDFGNQFGNSAHDIQSVSDWLSAAGLHVDSISNARSQIFFSGTVSAVSQVLATPLHYFSRNGEVRIGNTRDPQIPNALLPAIHSIRGLHAWKQHVSAQTVRATATAATGRRPMETYCPNGGTCQYTVFPSDFAKIYDLDGPNASALNGSGQTIAIVGRARVDVDDLTNFQKISGTTFAAPTVIVPPNGIDPGAAATTCSTSNPDTCSTPTDVVKDQVEATLDVERAGSIAPQAKIFLIVSADVKSSNGTLLDDGSDVATTYAIDTDPVPAQIVSISFGACEGDVGRVGTQQEAQLFDQAAAEGISVFVSSGDDGAAGCGGGSADSKPNANQSLSINAICAPASATCVGGTEFGDAANPSQYWAASDGNNLVSALGYIPEGAWNDPLDAQGKPQFAATGGGVSVYLPTPSWQTGTGVPGTQGRYVPDVSFAASNREPYFSCIAATGGSCVVGSDNTLSFIGSGGTSASTPSMAAITALLDQQQGSAQGNLNPRLYALAANTANGVFHDVTIASSGVANCSVTVPSLCNNSTPGPNGLSDGLAGYLVGAGYDEATGLGSIDVSNMIGNWSAQTAGNVNLDQHGLTGSWYNPATGGQGFEFEVYPDLSGAGQGLFTAGWFTYDATGAGTQRWYVLSGNVNQTDTSAVLQIAADYGGNFNAASSTLTEQFFGTASVSFSDCDHGTLSYNFTDGSGLSGTMALLRLDPNVTCGTAGDNGADPENSLLSGNWYNSATGGQGLIFDISPTVSNLFATWYTFAKNGASIGGGASQRWYTLQFGPFTANTTEATVPIFTTSGGKFDNPTSITSSQVGTADVSFQSCTALTLTYHFTSGENSGSTGTIALTRVGPTPAGCKL